MFGTIAAAIKNKREHRRITAQAHRIRKAFWKDFPTYGRMYAERVPANKDASYLVPDGQTLVVQVEGGVKAELSRDGEYARVLKIQLSHDLLLVARSRDFYTSCELYTRGYDSVRLLSSSGSFDLTLYDETRSPGLRNMVMNYPTELVALDHTMIAKVREALNAKAREVIMAAREAAQQEKASVTSLEFAVTRL